MKKALISILLFINIFSFNVSADSLPFSLIYGEDQELPEGFSYDPTSNILTIDASNYDEYLYLEANNDFSIHVKGEVILHNYNNPVFYTKAKRIGLSFENKDSSLTLINDGGSKAYSGTYPFYKHKSYSQYGKYIPYEGIYVFNNGYYLEDVLQNSLTFNDCEVDFNNLAQVDGELTKRFFDGSEESGDEKYESVKGFIIDTTAVKSVSYENDIYTVELTDYSDDYLYIELLFKESETFNFIKTFFVDEDLTTIVDAPQDTYDIDINDIVEGTMYKDDLNNYYYSYYITLAKISSELPHKKFSMMLKDKNGNHKYINVKFKTTPVNPPNNNDNNNDSHDDHDNLPKYVAPNTGVK